jgi:hypothetical protein
MISQTKRPSKWWLTFLWTWPVDLLTFLSVLIVWSLFGRKLQWHDGLWVELKKNSWFNTVWGYKYRGVTIGHGGILAAGAAGNDGIDTDTEEHELVHVEQFEAIMLAGLLSGIICLFLCSIFCDVWRAVIAGGVVWITAWPFGYTASLLQAYLRGEDAYHGSHLEEAAYSKRHRVERTEPP